MAHDPRDPLPDGCPTDDSFTLELRLCDDHGMVSHEQVDVRAAAPGLTYIKLLNNLRAHNSPDARKPYEGEPFTCTGSAHVMGEHIRCTSPAHEVARSTDALYRVPVSDTRWARAEPAPRHSITIGSSLLDGKYVAACVCGWTGEEQDTMREASADSASHLVGGNHAA